MDRTWAVMEHTILTYSGVDVDLRIPERFAIMNVYRIGDGAFMGSDRLRQVVVPKLIQSIGTEAFFGCGNLTDVYLPGTVGKIEDRAFAGCAKLTNLICGDVEISERSYDDLKSSCIKTDNSLYVAPVFPDIPFVKNALASTGYRPAARIPDGIERLFLSQNLSEDADSSCLSRNPDRFEFGNTRGSLTEEASFISLIGSVDHPVLDKDTEQKNDAFARVEKYPAIEKAAVFTFDDSQTRADGDKRWLTANLKLGYHFWQSKVAVKNGGKDYFIYRRHYLSTTSEYGYIRRDMAVFSESGLVTNRREAGEVYAKYKLLSIL